MQKDHLEMILEDMNAKLSNISEGYQVLNNKIDAVNNGLGNQIKELKGEVEVRFDYLDKKIDSVHDELIGTRKELKQEIRQIIKVAENHELRITEIEKVINL